MAKDTNSFTDEKTTKLRKPKRIVEDDDDINGTGQWQSILSDETLPTEKTQSNGHLPETPASLAVAAEPLALDMKESRQVSLKLSAQKPQVQSRKSKRADEEARMLRIRCKQICVSTFFRGHSPVRSLGFTSAIYGEGKSFLSRLAAEVMSEDDSTPVTLLECNWEHPSLDATFHLTHSPGLAEWLHGSCEISAIRHLVSPNLTVIPAGDSKNDPIGLLRTFQQRGVLNVLTRPDELLIVDLPSITTTAYGQLAAGLVDALILVVHMGVTSEGFIIEAEQMLKDLPVQGVVFNQVTNRLPRWLRQLL